MWKRRRLLLSAAAATVLCVSGVAAGTALAADRGTTGAAANDMHPHATITGARGDVYYHESGGTATMYISVQDTKTDGHCAQVWVDWLNRPGHHHDPGLIYQCGKNSKAGTWTFHEKTSEVSGVRMEVCRATTHAGEPQGCKKGDPDYPAFAHYAQAHPPFVQHAGRVPCGVATRAEPRC